MKTAAIVAALVIVGLFLGLASIVSIMTVKAGTWATEGSVEMLRLQLDVVRLQDEVLVQSRQRLERQLAELEQLAQRAAEMRAGAPVGYNVSVGESNLSWPDEQAGSTGVPSPQPQGQADADKVQR